MKIEVASIHDLKPIKYLYTTVTKHLRNNGVDQWNFLYPNHWIISHDVKKSHLHAMRKDEICFGAVVVNEEQSSKYADLPWRDKTGRPAVIHRLAVHPNAQGQGYGRQLLLYAEELIRSQEYTSIRLDAYTANPTAIRLYERGEYSPVGQIFFPLRKHPYQCFEKIF